MGRDEAFASQCLAWSAAMTADIGFFVELARAPALLGDRSRRLPPAP
jgi:hypothetical protein